MLLGDAVESSKPILGYFRIVYDSTTNGLHRGAYVLKQPSSFKKRSLVAQRYQHEKYMVQLLNVQFMKEKKAYKPTYGKRSSYFPGAFFFFLNA